MLFTMNALFNYLKRIFSWADEGQRKRRASNDLSEIYYSAPKKHCNHHQYSSRMDYIDLEDDGAVEIISEYISPVALYRKINGYKNSPPRSKPKASPTRKPQHYCEPDSFQAMAASSRTFRPPTTLQNINSMKEKKLYCDLLNKYIPDKERQPSHILRREAEKEPVQEVEIIELDQPKESQGHVSRRSFGSKTPVRVQHKSPARQPIAIVQLDDDVIYIPQTSKRAEVKSPVPPVNSLKDKYASHALLKPGADLQITNKYASRREVNLRRIEETKREIGVISNVNKLNHEAKLSEQLARSMRLCEPFLDDREEPEEPELPELTQQMVQQIKVAWGRGSEEQVLSNNFGLAIKRKDIRTLADLNWLNDEVINFYMNLLIERGKQEKFPNVYAMNTFFYPKLSQSGHSSLKRWTRKVDIFAQDYLVVPVHLGIHWCMSIIDFRNKNIRYYDSMGGNNEKCLRILRQYLEDESMDKKKKPYDTNDWKLECVKNIPQQMNGSDCGVFSCMFAEYITANKQITFSQDNMQYFRHKMVYEILHAKLL